MKQKGANKQYFEARTTLEKEYIIEKFCNDELKSSLQTIKNCKDGKKVTPSQFGAAKTIVEMQAKFLKRRTDKTPKPKDFIPKSDAEINGTLKKKEEKAGLLSMTFEPEATGT